MKSRSDGVEAGARDRSLRRSPYGDPNALPELESQAPPPDVLAKLRRARWKLLMPFAAHFAGFVFAVKVLVPIGGPWLAIGFFVVMVFVLKKWFEAVWSCPACRHPLGRSLTPESCGKCGQQFRRAV